ncbi:MAG: TrmB protein [Patescibacteria group bacterium]|nr:TrmB protein [Patescibacteria group bacterium]
MNLVESLKNLGLNEKEAKVYLALLQLGKTTAYNVAVKSGLKKPTTYVILGQLVEKGFVYNIPRAKKQLFVAESPEECFAIAKERLHFSEKNLPELLAMEKGKKNKVNVSYYEGLGGIRESYGKLIKVMRKVPFEKRNFVGFYAKTDNLEDDLNKYFDEVTAELAKYKIQRKGITTYNDLIAKKYLNALGKYSVSEMKALREEKYSSYISIEIFAGRFVHILSQRNLQSIIIEDADIADVMRQIFEMVWELVEKDRENYLKFSSVLDSNDAGISHVQEQRGSNLET